MSKQKLQEMQNNIVNFLKVNGEKSTAEMSGRLGYNYYYILVNLESLEEMKIVERVTKRRGTYWKLREKAKGGKNEN